MPLPQTPPHTHTADWIASSSRYFNDKNEKLTYTEYLKVWKMQHQSPNFIKAFYYQLIHKIIVFRGVLKFIFLMFAIPKCSTRIQDTQYCFAKHNSH